VTDDVMNAEASVAEYPYDTPYMDHFQRARGNLQYLDFIDMVTKMWSYGHPDVPVRPSGGEQFAQYPSIIYSLALRKAHPSEPKPKYRDEIITNPGEDGLIICGQRYQNVINFTVVNDDNPREAEELVEVFEDFMLEYTPIFKQMGLSEIVYARRLPDDDQPRVAENVNMRTCSYLVTTEKIIRTTYGKWNTMLIHAHIALDQKPFFSVHVSITAEVPWTTNAGSIFIVKGSSYKVGDTVVLVRYSNKLLPKGLYPNTPYHVVAVVDIPTDGMPEPPTGWPEQGYLLAYEGPTAQPEPILVTETVEIYDIGYIMPAPADLAESSAIIHTVDDDFQTPAP